MDFFRRKNMRVYI